MLMRRAAQRGLGMVELMVGITIGLIIVAAASVMMVGQINEHRRLTLETQAQQDLRVASDLMLRELRRAGFWAAPELQVWAPDQPAPAPNPYADGSGCKVETKPSQIVYAFSRADYGKPGANSTPQGPAADAKEYFGFRWRDNKILDFMLGCTNGKPNWQPLTDESALEVREFSVTPVVQAIPLDAFCSKPCTDEKSCPRQEIRRYDIKLIARSVFDRKVERSYQFSSRARNDVISGACPA